MDNINDLLVGSLILLLALSPIALVAYVFACVDELDRSRRQLLQEGLADIRNRLQEEADAAAWETRKRRIDLEVALATAEEEARQARG